MADDKEFDKSKQDLETISHKEFKKTYRSFDEDEEGIHKIDLDRQFTGEKKLDKLSENLANNWHVDIQDSYKSFHKKLQERFGETVDTNIKISDHRDYTLNALADSLLGQLNSLTKNHDEFKNNLTKNTLGSLKKENFKDEGSWRDAVFSAYSRFSPHHIRDPKTGEIKQRVNLGDYIAQIEKTGKLSSLYDLFSTRKMDLKDHFYQTEVNGLYPSHIVKDDHFHEHLMDKLKNKFNSYEIKDEKLLHPNLFGDQLRKLTKGVSLGSLSKDQAELYGLTKLDDTKVKKNIEKDKQYDSST